MSWDPALYERFRSERERPFHDLLARVPDFGPQVVVDLGCGTGRNTAHLASRYPEAHVVGIDRAPTMLHEASARQHRLHFVRGDLRRPPVAPIDLLVSNAAFHWVPDHATLLPALARRVRSGGCLAFQVPANQEAPSHRAVAQLVASPRWRHRLGGTLAPGVLSVADYESILAGQGWVVTAWDVVYPHRLAGAAAVLDWISGTTLSRVFARLDPNEAAAFRAELLDALRAAYGDGTEVAFPFRRRFVVATKPAAD